MVPNFTKKKVAFSWIRKENAFSFVILGSFQFILLTFIAMIFYAGGTRIDPTTQGYGFFTNFFSDLGRTVTYSGQLNYLSAFLFITAVIGLGMTFFVFFSFIPEFFNRTEEERKISKIVSQMGRISAIAFIGVAFTPANLVGIIHDLFVVSGFSFVTVVLTLLFILTVRVPNIITLEHLFLKATIQILVVYTLIACFIFQSYGVWRRNIKTMKIPEKTYEN
ncbi:MAG: hypothetical protein ACXACR_04120 [Candidatus Hodarchaeales archaeon]|jgi:hypothetical protein